MKSGKRLISYLLSATVILSMSTSVFADNSKAATKSADAVMVEELGMLIGEGEGVTLNYLKKEPTRIQAAVMFIRLKGLEKEALSFKGTQYFDDVNEAAWAKSIMGYLKANPDLGWVGDGKNFNPNDLLTPQMYYKVMLEAIGYKANTDFKWADVISYANSKGLNKVANVTTFTVSDLATATVEALKATVKEGNKTLIQKLADNDATLKSKAQDAGLIGMKSQLSFDTLNVKTATSFTAKFNNSIDDTSKVIFNVTRDGAKVDGLTVSWNNGKTEVTLSNSSNLVNGTYNVSVIYDNTSIGSKSAVVESEKISKIEFTSDSVILTSDTTGEIYYKVLNQYGDDITDSRAARKIKWTTSANSITANTQSGILAVVENGSNELKDVDTVSVTAFDEASGYVTSESLNVSEGQSLLKKINFKGIVNENGANEDIYVDSTELFYIDFEATDSNGNKLDSYTLLSNTDVFKLFTSNKDIVATVVRDPSNISKAKIEISTHSEEGTADITGIAVSSGKTDKITVTVKKGATLSSFKISEPSEDTNAGEKVEIPFVAKDQDGSVLTKYEDISGKVDFTISDSSNGSITQEKGTDGKFKLYAWFNKDKKYTIYANVDDTSSTSQITLDVGPAAVPSTLYDVSKDVVYPYIVKNGQIKVDFVNKAFMLYDQDNNEISLLNNNVINSKYYYIKATSSDATKVVIPGSNDIAYKDEPIILTGGSVKGTTTITFELCEDTDNNPDNGKTVLSSRAVTVSNIDKSQITSYEFEVVETLYANPDIADTDTYEKASEREQEYAGDIVIYGKTTNNSKVAINPIVGSGNDILLLSAMNTDKFYVSQEYKKIIAKTIGSDSEAATKLVATMLMENGQITTVSTDVKSTKEIPTVKSMEVSLEQGSQLVRTDDSFSGTQSSVTSALVGKELRRFNKSGDDSDRAKITFDIKDQYGKYGMLPVYFTISKVKGSGGLAIDAATGLVTGSVKNDDQYTISAVAIDGTIKTATITVN